MECSSHSDCPGRFDCPYAAPPDGRAKLCRCHQFWAFDGPACDVPTALTRALGALSVLNAACFAAALLFSARTLRSRWRQHRELDVRRWSAIDTTMLWAAANQALNLIWAVGYIGAAFLNLGLDRAHTFERNARPFVAGFAALAFVAALLNVSVMWLEVATDTLRQSLKRRRSSLAWMC